MDSDDKYYIFNVEKSDIILDIYYEMNQYCNESYISLHNNGNFGEFINMIYNNTNLNESLDYIKNKTEDDYKHEDEKEYENNILNEQFELN